MRQHRPTSNPRRDVTVFLFGAYAVLLLQRLMLAATMGSPW